MNFIINFLSSNSYVKTISFLISLTANIIALISFVWTVRDRRKPVLRIASNTSSLVQIKKEYIDKLQISYDGKLVNKNIYQVFVHIYNNGVHIINSDDIYDEDPIKILLDDGNDILDVIKKRQSAESCHFQTSYESNIVQLQFDIMDINDYIDLLIVFSSEKEEGTLGTKEKQLHCMGRIKGEGRIQTVLMWKDIDSSQWLPILLGWGMWAFSIWLLQFIPIQLKESIQSVIAILSLFWFIAGGFIVTHFFYNSLGKYLQERKKYEFIKRSIWEAWKHFWQD